MRILVINYEYPPIGGGGGQVCQSIAEELAHRGDEMTVLTAYLAGLQKEEIINGVRVIRVPSLREQPYKADFLTMGMFIIAAILPGYKVIRDWRPELIHVHFAVPSGAAAWILHRLTGVPYVLTAHLGDIPGGVPEKTGRWFRWVFPLTVPIWKSAAQCTAISDHTASLAYQHYGISPQVIANGIAIKIVDSEQLAVNKPPVIVFVGRFVQQKNLAELVEVLNQIRDLPWRCVLVGDGPLRDDIQLRIGALGLKDRFTLTGWVSPEDVQHYLEQSDVLLMPSLSEGLPMVGIQALACGLAIVANDVGGFSELVAQDQNGYLGNVGDRSALVDALRRYLSDPWTLLNARRCSLERASRFDIKAIVDQYEIVFQRALQAKNKVN
jgi:glycosyltransferase involved in cell wall biosynthesis